MRTEPLYPPDPGRPDYGNNGYGREDHPEGPEPREPSWSDVIGGIWRRLVDPTPGT